MKALTKSALFALLALVSFSPAFAQKEFVIRGIMIHTKLEGGCWYLDAGPKHYEVYGDKELLDQLHQDNKFFALRVTSMKGAASVCMVGDMVRLVSIEDTVMHPYDPPIMPMKLVGKVHSTKDGVWYVQDSKGHKYNFHSAPAKKYRKSGAAFSHDVRILILRDTGYAGEILDDYAPKRRPGSKAIPTPTPDPR